MMLSIQAVAIDGQKNGDGHDWWSRYKITYAASISWLETHKLIQR